MLDDRLRAAGATSVFLDIPWAEHAFDAIPNGLSGQLSLYYTEEFLAWALMRPVVLSPLGQTFAIRPSVSQRPGAAVPRFLSKMRAFR
jgi:hypothetical protein